MDRDPRTGRFLTGNPGGPGRPRLHPSAGGPAWQMAQGEAVAAPASPECPDDDAAIDTLCRSWVAMALMGHFEAMVRLFEAIDGPD